MTKTLAARVKTTVKPPVRAPTPVVRPMLLQPALRVGAVNDPAEREAEVMAARVVAASAPALAVASPTGTPGAPPAVRRNAEDQPNLDQLNEGSVPADQADVEVPKTEDVATEGLESGDLSELESGKPDDSSGEPPAPEAPPIEDPPIAPVAPMRREETGAVVGRMGGAAPQDVSNLVSNPGPGRPLPRSVRQRIEPHFGTSFRDVRLHDSAADRRAATRIGARAFTHKQHIWLGHGESETNTRLMAHELTHVVQQTRGADTLPLARAPAAAVIRRGYFADKAESVARHVPGYTLITVLVGRKLISGDRVPMTGENLLGGFMGLIPGGTLIFDRLKEARVIEEAFTWVKGKLGELNLTWARIKSDLGQALDTLNPFKAARNVTNMVKNLVRDIVRFVAAIARKLLEFIVRGALKLAGTFGEKVWGILKRAGQVINLILEDPLGFAKNLVKAVVGGFKQFGKNIWEHLKKGLLGWLFGSLSSAGIEMPAKLDFRGLMSIVLQILGLTYANFRKQLVRKLGPRGEKMVSMMETSVEVVKTLMKEGFAGIWQKLLGMIDSFRQTVIGGISEMIITTMIKAGIGWLAGLSNPVGAIVKVVLSIYNLIVAFIERFQQIVDVCESIFNSIGAIARGQVKHAADFIEQTIGRSVPLIISFLAALIPVTGITSRIKKVIKKLQAPVKKAMGKLIGFLVKKAKKLFSRLIGKVNGKRKYPSINFKIGKKQHRIFAVKKGRKLEVRIASKQGRPVDELEACHARQMKLIDKTTGEGADKSRALGKKMLSQTDEAGTDTQKIARLINPENKQENQRKRIEALKKELESSASALEQATRTIDQLPQISSQTDTCLFRAAEPRLEKLEGKHGPHAKLLKEAKDTFNAERPKLPYRVTSFYEMDHTMEKRFAKTVLENLPLIDPKTAASNTDEVVVSADRADRAGKLDARQGNKKGTTGKKAAVSLEDATPLGEIGASIKKIPETAPAFPAIAVYRHNHVIDKGLKDHKAMIEKARSKKNPHAYIKSTLKAQLKLEEEEMLAKIEADTAATAKIKSNMKNGVAAARARNETLFGLGDVEAREVTADEKKERDNQEQSSNLAFKGGKGAPNFLALEGVGGAYGSLDKNKYLERDHIVDKAYPKMAAALDLLNDSEKKDFEARVRTALKARNKRMSAKRQARMDEVRSARIFPPGSRMANYTEGRGYAIPFYTPVAREITSKTGRAISPAKMAEETTDNVEQEVQVLVDYVIEGTNAGLDTTRATRSKRIIDVVDDRAKKHITHVKTAYEENKKLTLEPHQNSPQKAAVNAHMNSILDNVNKSLAKAREETKSLF